MTGHPKHLGLDARKIFRALLDLLETKAVTSLYFHVRDNWCRVVGAYSGPGGEATSGLPLCTEAEPPWALAPEHSTSSLVGPLRAALAELWGVLYDHRTRALLRPPPENKPAQS
jgi:hypothetical protein